MHTNTNKMVKIIDLCTSDVDMTDIVEESPTLTTNIPIASTITVHRILDSNPRLSILPLYPIYDEQDHMKYPLLPNLARKYSKQIKLQSSTVIFTFDSCSTSINRY